MGVVLLLVVAALLVNAARSTLLRVTDITERDVRWIQGVGTTDLEVFNLIHRYLFRLRMHRWIGGVGGALLAVLYGAAFGHRITAVFGAERPWADVIFGGLVGLMIGSATGEAGRALPLILGHHDPGSVPSASIRPSVLQPVSWVLVGLTVALSVDDTSDQSVSLAVASLVMVVVHAVLLTVARSGRRQLLPLDLRHADDSLRAHSVVRFESECLAFAILLFGWQWRTTLLSGSLLGGVVLFSCLAVVAMLLGRGRPYPGRDLVRER